MAYPCRRRLPSASAAGTGTSGNTRPPSRRAASDRRFPAQLGKRQTVGQLDPGEGLADALKLLDAAARFHVQGLQAFAAGVHGGLLAGRECACEIVRPAFQSNAVGGVAAVADQPDLLAHQVDGVGQRDRGVTASSEAVRLARAGIRSRWKSRRKVAPASVDGS